MLSISCLYLWGLMCGFSLLFGWCTRQYLQWCPAVHYYSFVVGYSVGCCDNSRSVLLTIAQIAWGIFVFGILYFVFLFLLLLLCFSFLCFIEKNLSYNISNHIFASANSSQSLSTQLSYFFFISLKQTRNTHINKTNKRPKMLK